MGSWLSVPLGALTRAIARVFTKNTFGFWECAEQKTIYTLLSDAQPRLIHSRPGKARFYVIDLQADVCGKILSKPYV